VTDQNASESLSVTTSRVDQVNRWLSLGANFGVLRGLFILVFEVRQTATLTRTTIEIGAKDSLSAIEFSLATPHSIDAWVKSVRSPHTMTDRDIRIVEAHLVAVQQQWDMLFQMEDAGLVTRARITSHISNTAPFYFGSAHAKNWWRLQETGWEKTAMYEVAGPIINAIDPNFLRDYLDASRLPPPNDPVPSETTR